MAANLPALPTEPPTQESDDGGDDALQAQFYTAAMAHGTGSDTLDLLLKKGLYGDRLPKELRGKKAAEAFQQAFDLIGGVPRLALWADKNPTAFYSLFSKLIPSSVKTELNARITIDAPWMSPNRLSYLDKDRSDVVDVTPTSSKD